MSTLLLASALSAAASGISHAQEPRGALVDPTRPPSVRAAQDGVGRIESAASRLQSILISPQRRMAVIDGRTVALGGRVGTSTLVRVSETSVTLREGDKLTVLELYPDVSVATPGHGEANNKKKGSP